MKCDVFGRKLGDLIEEGMYYKLNTIPENASMRIHDILSKIVNKGNRMLLQLFYKGKSYLNTGVFKRLFLFIKRIKKELLKST